MVVIHMLLNKKFILASKSASRKRLLSKILSRVIISDYTAKTSGNIMRNRVPHLQNSENPHAILAAKPSIFGTLFPSFGGVVLDFL